MSFSHEVKEELAERMGSGRHCQMAELAAMLHFSGQYGRDDAGNFTIGFQTENETVIKKERFTKDELFIIFNGFS